MTLKQEEALKKDFIHPKERICTRCKKTKPTKEFSIIKKDIFKVKKNSIKSPPYITVYEGHKYSPYCKECHRKASRLRRISFKYRYNRLKTQAHKRGKVLEIIYDDYVKLISKPCFYCGEIKEECGVGLDRIDNSKGYVLGNVVSCCGECNLKRGYSFEADRFKYFIDWLKKIGTTTEQLQKIKLHFEEELKKEGYR
jgi:hypothetical protein